MGKKSRKADTAVPSENAPAELVLPPEPAELPALPGIQSVDDDLVESAITEIQRIHAEKAPEIARQTLQMYLRMGEYLIATFFSGNIDNFVHADAHRSFRALEAAQDRLPVSYVTLWNSVAIHKQYPQLPEQVRDRLGFAHHRALLTVKDPDIKTGLAEQAVEKSLTEKQLRELARSKRPESKAGRRADPDFVRCFKGLRRVMQDAPRKISELGNIKPDAALKLIAELEGDIRTAQGLLEAAKSVASNAKAAEREHGMGAARPTKNGRGKR